jgi:glycosyltransferase involved in cell wall biosynthesis
MMRKSLQEMGHKVNILWNFGERSIKSDFEDVDVVIVQWPEALLTPQERNQCRNDTLCDLQNLLDKIKKKARVLYVSHNLCPLDKMNESFERSLYQLILTQTDGILHHSHCGQHKLLEHYSIPGQIKHYTIRHPVYRPSVFFKRSHCRNALGMNDEKIWLLSIGSITGYKGHERMIKYLIESKNKNLGLAFAGQVYNKDYGNYLLNELEKLRTSGVEVIANFSWLSEDEVATWIFASDAILFFHDQDHLTSGLPHLAEGYETPLVGFHNDYTEEIITRKPILLNLFTGNSYDFEQVDKIIIENEIKLYQEYHKISRKNYPNELHELLTSVFKT